MRVYTINRLFKVILIDILTIKERIKDYSNVKIMSKTGELIKKLRQEKGLTQSQLAKELGISDKTVGKWEQGVGYPDISFLLPIANYFGITTDELLNGNLNSKEEDINKSVNERIVLSGVSKISSYLEKGIDIFGKDEFGKTVIDYIYEQRNIEFLKYAIEHNWFVKRPFRITEKIKQAGLPTRNILKNGFIFYQKHLTNDNRNNSNHTQEIDFDKVLYSTQRYPLLNEKEYYFDNDLINIMSIAIENEDISILNEINYYQYFLSANRVLQIFEPYSKRGNYCEDFMKEIVGKNDIYILSYLFYLGIKNNNKNFIHNLIRFYKTNPDSLGTQYLNDMVKYNDDLLNKDVILTNSHFLTNIDIKTAYLQNKYIFDRLPEEYKKAKADELVDLVDNNSKIDELLYTNPLDLISKNKTDLLKTYLSMASKATEDINSFIKEIVELKKSKSIIQEFNKDIKHKFNSMHNRIFKYGNIYNGIGSEEAGWRVPLKDRDRLLEEFNNTLKDDTRLLIIFNETSETKLNDVLYKSLIPIFIREFDYNISKMSDEILLILIPYLDVRSKNLLLNYYNGESSLVLKELLKSGAKFYLNKSSNLSMQFKILQPELRSTEKIKNDEELNKNLYDNKKTLNYKVMLGIVD